MTSRFPEAKKGARDAFDARDQESAGRWGGGSGETVGADRRHEGLRPPDRHRPVAVKDSGQIEYDPWYGRFFEYGTVYIPASPFMRPAHRKMRKVFKDEMGANFEPWVRKRTGWR
jgi:HK97 gp10 family phage protein